MEWHVRKARLITGRGTWLAMVLTVLFVTGASAADLFVQAGRADLRAAPALGAEKLTTLPRGERLTPLEEAGGWYRVGHGEQTGWVPRLMVGPRPPAAAISILDDGDAELGTEARRRASQFSSAAAARGLSARARASDRSRPNYHLLKEMESLNIDEAEVLRFLAEGGQ